MLEGKGDIAKTRGEEGARATWRIRKRVDQVLDESGKSQKSGFSQDSSQKAGND